MGSSASKGARTAGSTVRKFPTRVPNHTNQTPAPPAPPAAQPGPPAAARPSPQTQASATRNDAIDVDGRDPGLAARLNKLGAVQPNPHFSPSSTSNYDPRRNTAPNEPSDMMQAPPQSAFPDARDNPALRVLAARERIQEEAEQELVNIGRKGFQGRKYVDAGTITLALMRMERGEPHARIEEFFGLERGRLGVLKPGVVKSVS